MPDAQSRMLEKIETLKKLVRDFHWMARRYADYRQSYATGMFNENTRAAIALGVELNPTGDETIWARDRDGRGCDGLTEAEAALGRDRSIWANPREEAISALREIASGAELCIRTVENDQVVMTPTSPREFAAHVLRSMEGAHEA